MSALIRKLSPERLLLLSLMSWAIFSFVSNSLLALSHVFLFLGIILFLVEKKDLSPTKSTLCLCAFTLFGLLSVLLNTSDLIKPLAKIFKLKYLMAGISLSLLSVYYKNFLLRHRAKILLAFLGSFLFAVAYSYIKLGAARLSGDFGYRPSGFFGMILSYAYTAQFPVLLIGFLCFHPEVRFQYKMEFLNNRYLRWGLFVAVLIQLYLSQTRGGILGVLLGTPLLLFWKNRKLFYALSLSGVIFVSFVFWNSFSGALKSENRIFMSSSASPNEDRISQYKMAIKAFESAPYFGVGWRSLDERSVGIKTKYKLPFPDNASHAHNIFLEALATTGVAGFFCFFLWILLWFKEAVISNKSMWRSYYLAIIAAFAVSGLFQSTIIDSEFSFTLFVLYGLTPLFVEIKPYKSIQI